MVHDTNIYSRIHPQKVTVSNLGICVYVDKVVQLCVDVAVNFVLSVNEFI